MEWRWNGKGSNGALSPLSHQANGPALVQDDVLERHHVRVGQLAQDLDLAQGGDGDTLK
jgi:hypothetical protein